MIARIDNNWIRCSGCGHKLGRLLLHGKTKLNGIPAIIEIKCSSCKELNVIPVKTGKTDADNS